MTVIEFRERQTAKTDHDLPMLTEPTVVVAVDDRPASADALEWAADEALCRGMKLRVVTAYADPQHPYAPKTVEQALAVQRRLRRQVERGRPWVDEAEQIVRRGCVRSLLAEALAPGDLLVIGEAAGISAMDPSLRPTCPLVVVPATVAPLDDLDLSAPTT